MRAIVIIAALLTTPVSAKCFLDFQWSVENRKYEKFTQECFEDFIVIYCGENRRCMRKETVLLGGLFEELLASREEAPSILETCLSKQGTKGLRRISHCARTEALERRRK